MPRRFNWKQDGVHELVQDYLAGKIQSARQLYNFIKDAGFKVSKNTVYSRVRSDLRKRRQRPRIALLATPKYGFVKKEMRGHYRVPWNSQSVKRLIDSYIIYKREKPKEALKNHVMDRRRLLTMQHGKGNLKKFDRLNYEPTDSNYYDSVGAQVFSKIDEWYNMPNECVKWDEKYDEPTEKSWLQTIRSQLKEELENNKDTNKTNKEEDQKTTVIETSNASDETPKILPQNYKIRLIRHERQKRRSYVIEEQPGQFYHYVKTRQITVECSECRKQFKRYGESGQIARLVVSERKSQCLERVSSHHFACFPRSEAEIRHLEVENNVEEAICVNDELEVLKKAEKQALEEIRKVQIELNINDY
ncbi:hypothetical protein M3Y97_00326300 [Aphelenchoides bicaudatus]|nr:hypothetical protein M3Y97_00326300 [Aphelenchoides bicaudatus]